VTLTTGAKRVAIIVFWAGAVASALGGRALGADRSRSARAHTEAARAYFNLEKYREAIGEYEQAYLDKQDPAYFFEIAECHRLLGDFAEARRFYQRFLHDAPRGHTRRAVAEARLSEAIEMEKQAEAAAPSPGVAGGARPLPLSFPPSSRYLAPLPSSGSANAATPASPTTTTEPPTKTPGSPPGTPEAPVPSAPPSVSTAPNPEAVGGPPTLVVAPAPEPAPPPSSGRPIYARWWFWTIIGGVVAGGVAAGLVLASASPSRPSCPAGVSCQ